MDHYSRQQGAKYWCPQTDPTMPQKVAFISGHFLLEPGARLGDMGCGWGEGSYYLAQVNPHIQVVGIDNDPKRIELAQEKYRLPNLSYVLGDIETPPTELGRFDGFLNSSVLHHVYSYKDYQIEPVLNALRNQFAALNPNGLLAIRDFVTWPKDSFGYIDLPHDREGTTPETMSSADLLVLYSKVARSLAEPESERGFFLDEVASSRRGWRRFYLSRFWMAEFMLRKDYRKAFENEIQEVYSFFSADRYREELEKLGGRVVYRGPFWNRWIVMNRWAQQASLWDEGMKPIDFPPTNYVALVQKTGSDSSVWLGERAVARDEPAHYLRLASYRNDENGMLYDMVSRPGEVVDCLPYLEVNGDLFVAAKSDYPRPLVNVVPRGTVSLDGKLFSGHLIEPVALANVRTEADIAAGVTKKAGLTEQQIESVDPALTYYPAPGLADEIVQSRFIKLREGTFDPSCSLMHHVSPDVSGFSDSGSVRLFRAQELLRAAQVGILPEARLELNIYALMRARCIEPEAWIDGVLDAPQVSNFTVKRMAFLLRNEARQLFAPSAQDGGYLSLRRSLFEERSTTKQLTVKPLEFVLPVKASAQAGVLIPLAKAPNGEICIGMDELDLPAPQMREGSSRIFAAPIYRLPLAIHSYHEAQAFLADKIGTHYGRLRRLGEGFYSSIGMTPEKLYPFVVSVDPDQIKEKMHFVPLTSFFTKLETLRDAPLMIGGLRAIHALGLWSECQKARGATLACPLTVPQAPANG